MRAKRSPAGGFWLLAGGWCVLFFSLSGSKLPTYILPAFPFLCLALGEFVARIAMGPVDRHPRPRRRDRGPDAGLALRRASRGTPGSGHRWAGRSWSSGYVGDPDTVVVTYPRNCDSVAFYTGRSDFDRVRSKDVNQLDRGHAPPAADGGAVHAPALVRGVQGGTAGHRWR